MLRAKVVPLAVLAGLVASACGSRLPSDVLEAIDARGAGQVSGPATAAGPAAGGGVATGPATGTTDAGSGPAAATGETAAAAEGPSDPAERVSRCDEAISAAPGVTDTEIRVASIVTDSGPLPGATAGAFRGASSYFAMVNANGGVCGRRITLVKGDDGLDPGRARGEFLRLEPSVFAFVGSFAVADSGYVDLIESTGVPYVATVVEPEGRGPRNVFPRTPEGIVATGPFVWWKQQHPGVSRAAVIFADVGGVAANIPGFEAAIERAGFDRRYTAAASAITPDFTPEVRQAQDQRIEFFYLFAFEVNMHVRMVRNMRQQNYDPPIKGSNIAFNTRFSELLGSDGDGWQNHQPHLLFLDPSERERSEALASFMDWNERTFPGAQLDLFPVSGWGSAAIFVDGLQRIEDAISRENLIEALWTIDSYDTGGIEAPVDPRTGLGNGCFNIAEHRNGQWTRLHPTDRLFDCETGELFQFG